MNPTDTARVQFEEAVVAGAILSPALLTALPFLSAAAINAILVLLVILLGASSIGYFKYRSRVYGGGSFHIWRISLLLLLALAMFATMSCLVFTLGGFIATICTASLFAVMVAITGNKMPKTRATGYKGNHSLAISLGAIGAAGVGAISLTFGAGFVQLTVAILHFSLALIATALLIRASQETCASKMPPNPSFQRTASGGR